jgi:hypothetical protein
MRTANSADPVLGCLEEHFSHPWKSVPLELIIGHSMTSPKPPDGIGLPTDLFDAMRLVYRIGRSQREPTQD